MILPEIKVLARSFYFSLVHFITICLNTLWGVCIQYRKH